MEAIQKAIAKAKAKAEVKVKAEHKKYEDNISGSDHVKPSVDASHLEPTKDKLLTDTSPSEPDTTKSEPENTTETTVSDVIYNDISDNQMRIIEASQRELFTKRVHAGSSNNMVADIFKMLRAQLLLQMREKNLQTLAITSATQGVGKSLVSVNLAISLSLETNQTIMLVDLDLKRPNVAYYFGIDSEIEQGIGDYLLNDIPLNEVLINPGIERLVLLPGRKSYQNSPEIISSQKMFDLIDELKSRNKSRIIIFDLPPILATSDAFSLMPHFDASLLVIEDGRNTRDELSTSVKMMEKTEFLGSVLNKGNIQKTSYY